MLKKILKLLYIKWFLTEKATPEREHRFSGHWVNKGSKKEENWVWVEHETDYQHCFLNVCMVDGGFIIVKSTVIPLDDCIEWVECLSYKDEERGTQLLYKFYKRHGGVILGVE